MKFYIETVPQTTQSVFDKIKDIFEIQAFYLSGGTALSLLLGQLDQNAEIHRSMSKPRFQLITSQPMSLGKFLNSSLRIKRILASIFSMLCSHTNTDISRPTC